MLPDAIQNSIEALSDLPGIGSRSAERLVFNLLRNESGLAENIARHLKNLRPSICECSQCCNYMQTSEENSADSQNSSRFEARTFHQTETSPPPSDKRICQICEKSDRDKRSICIVETPMDLIALERTHQFKGLYHVLHGVISPINRITAENLRMNELLNRDLDTVEEIILALDGTTEAEATALSIADQLERKNFRGKITRLARGIPSGGDLDYLDAGTLTRAMSERRTF